MSNTNISIIQLIKSREISVGYEISNLQSARGIHVYIRAYLNKVNHYWDIKKYIAETQQQRLKTSDLQESLQLDDKLQNLYKIETDYITNVLYLAETLSKIEPRTDRLKKTIELFEAGKISEADANLREVDLLNDQHNLICLVEYLESQIKYLEDKL